jgi:superkiller protein 3
MAEYAAGQYEKALRAVASGLHLSPTSALLYYTQGLCHQHLNQAKEAKEAFQKCLRLSPEDTDALYNLARLYYNENDAETALAYAELSLNLMESTPDGCNDVMTYNLMGYLHEALQQTPQAISMYTRSLALDPAQVDIGIFLSRLYAQVQEVSKAIETLVTVTAHDPTHADAFYELSLCLAKSGDWTQTIDACKQVITINPLYTKAYNQLGLALYCVNDLGDAIQYYQKALEIDPNYVTALNNLAYTYEKMERYAEAIQTFTAYLNHDQVSATEKAEVQEHLLLIKQKLPR